MTVDTFGRRLQAALQLADMTAPDIERASGVKAATINALIRRGSDQQSIIEAIPAIIGRVVRKSGKGGL